MIRTLLCAVFLRRCITLYNKERLAVTIFFSYLIGLGAFYAVVLATMFVSANSIGVDCGSERDWQSISLLALDTFQTLLILLTYLVSRNKASHEQKKMSVLTDMEDDIKKRFEIQMLILTVFYIVATTADWVLLKVGQEMFRNGHLLCGEQSTVQVKTW